MNTPPAIRLFRLLTSVPTAPFREQSVARVVRGWIRERCGPAVRVSSSRGGMAASYRTGPGPSLVLAAHMDHPGFHLRSVGRQGAKAELLGGLRPELLEGARISAYAAGQKHNRPAATGTLGRCRGTRSRTRGRVYPLTWDDPPAPGTKPDFAMLALTPFEVRGGWLLSRSIDDLLGCAVCLETLRRISRARTRTNLTVLLHRAEEVGFVGALEMIRTGALRPEDSFVSVETSLRRPDAVPGRGPVIRLGDKALLFDPGLTAFLADTAARLRRPLRASRQPSGDRRAKNGRAGRGLRFQRARLPGGTCEATAHAAHGYQSSGLAIPLVNYHNRGRGRVEPEKVRLSDVEPAVRLLAEASRRFPAAELRGGLRARLEERRRLRAHLL